MTLEQYSLILSVGILLLGGVSVLSWLGYALSPAVRTRLHSVDYFVYIKLMGLIACVSTVGALTYQLYYLTPVCILCWWQRVFMFPLDIILLIALRFRDRLVHVMCAVLTSLGAAVAAYHYYYHFQGFVLGRTLTLPCSQFGLLPACTESPILIFGFITIPLMALVAFVALLTLCFFAQMSLLHNSSQRL